MIPLKDVQILNQTNVLDFPATSEITELGFRRGGLHLRHSKEDVWPPVGFETTTQQATLWILANINNAYPWGWWVGYGLMTMIAFGGVGFTITGLVEVLGMHRYHPMLRPAVLMGLLCYISAETLLLRISGTTGTYT